MEFIDIIGIIVSLTSIIISLWTFLPLKSKKSRKTFFPTEKQDLIEYKKFNSEYRYLMSKSPYFIISRYYNLKSKYDIRKKGFSALVGGSIFTAVVAFFNNQFSFRTNKVVEKVKYNNQLLSSKQSIETLNIPALLISVFVFFLFILLLLMWSYNIRQLKRRIQITQVVMKDLNIFNKYE